MVKLKTGKPKGLLNRNVSQKKFELTRYLPAPDLAYFVEHYWQVVWDLRGQEPYTSENLPYPSVNLVFEPGQAAVYGVVTDKFSRHLEGAGRVFAVKFRPGAFYPFVRWPVSRLTDRAISLAEAFGPAGETLAATITCPATETVEYMIELTETFLRQREPERDEQIMLINHIIDQVVAERTITRVDDLVDRFHMSRRTLQRLFSQYVGVSPKWVIKRYRLQEAAEQLAAGQIDNWSRLAQELGYFDQAHFIKDFKMIVGRPPGDYARQVG